MNVEKEIAAARRRIQAQIDTSARAALIRIGVNVEAEERAQREAAEAERLRLMEERRRAAEAAAEQLGRNLRGLRDSFVRLAEGIARGFDGGAR